MATDVDCLLVVYELDDKAARAGFDRVKQSATQANAQVTASMRQSEQAADQMGKKVAGVGRLVGPAAVQFGDFAVQVSAGTSAMRAAGQQLPQFLGYFGTWGMVAGGVAAVMFPLADVILRTVGASKSLSEQMASPTVWSMLRSWPSARRLSRAHGPAGGACWARPWPGWR